MEDGVPGIGGCAAQRRHPSAISRNSFSCREACRVTAWRAIAESVMRSAQRPAHHARSSGAAKHHADAPGGGTSSKPAACAHARRNRPASGSARVAARDFAVQLQPAVDRGLVGVPAEGAVITVARRDQPARLAHSLHLGAARQRDLGDAGALDAHARCQTCRPNRVEGVQVADREARRRRATAGVTARPVESHRPTRSMPRTRPGATRRPISAVIVPGPHPTSSRLMPGCSHGSRYAAEFAAVRQRCELSTLSWCPCV